MHIQFMVMMEKPQFTIPIISPWRKKKKDFHYCTAYLCRLKYVLKEHPLLDISELQNELEAGTKVLHQIAIWYHRIQSTAEIQYRVAFLRIHFEFDSAGYSCMCISNDLQNISLSVYFFSIISIFLLNCTYFFLLSV